jgi:hypothetical protein
MAKKQVCFTLEETILKEFEELRAKTGVSISTLIELRLKGYEVKKMGQIT